MTPQRVNQARFLLNWSRQQLAGASGLGVAEIAAFEAGFPLHPLKLAALHKTLACAGIKFAAEGCVVRAGVRAQILTGQQCQSARQLLGWSQRQLGRISGVPASAISQFERTGADPSPRSGGADRLEILRSTLQAAGVVFSDGADVCKADP